MFLPDSRIKNQSGYLTLHSLSTNWPKWTVSCCPTEGLGRAEAGAARTACAVPCPHLVPTRDPGHRHQDGSRTRVEGRIEIPSLGEEEDIPTPTQRFTDRDVTTGSLTTAATRTSGGRNGGRAT